ncbi:MAG: YaiO family outer membrane beta-barrel protein [Gemmatimonadetes bacterium]|nr:YaiO family outer membrane beta-barrel protein [Gemmatimonadota bacterium]
MNAALIALAAALAAPRADTSGRWQASATYGFETFTRERATWHVGSLVAGRRFARGTVLAEGLLASRFARTDPAGALDGYYTFAPRVYGNLRVQVAPDAEVIARTDVAAELFRGLRGGWEASAGYRRMDYRSDAVDIVSLGVARYVRSWYVRARGTVVPKGGRAGVSALLLARRYGATSDDVTEVSANLGEQVVTIGAGPAVELRATATLAARWQRRLRGPWGLAVGATWTSDERSPARAGLTTGAFTRW